MNTQTFGIELEFIALVPPTLNKDILPVQVNPPPRAQGNISEGRVGEALYHALIYAGIPATGYEDSIADKDSDDSCSTSSLAWSMDHDDGLSITDDVPSYTRWRVDTDCLDLSQREEVYVPPGWEVEAVELSSRKFDFYRDDWRSEIARVLQVLRELEVRGCRFLTNKTTGFHVHVGNGTQPIPLRTAKNVFQLLTAHEKSLDGIHAVSRILAPTPAHYHHYYYPLSFFHANAGDPEGDNNNVFDWLANIEEGVTTYKDLGDFFTYLRWSDTGEELEMDGHHSSLNFDNLFADESKGRYEERLTGTIEFRQHAGTLDWLEIVAWVMLVANVVEFCGKVSDEEMVQLCLRAGGRGFGLEDLFAALDTNEDVMDHYLNGGSGATIGTLNNQQVQGPIPPEGLFNSILEQNDHESTENSSPEAVSAAISGKYHYGYYGLKPQTEIEVTIEAVIAGLRQAMVTVGMRDIDPSSERGRSECRAQVFREFAWVYEKGWTSLRLPLTSDVY